MNEQTSAWLTVIDRLPEVHSRLKRVVIMNRNALDVVKQQDGDKTLFYLDPPYLPETRTTTEQYEHEMADADHRKLLEVLSSVKGKFLLSGYPSDLYNEFELKHGWSHVDFNLANHVAGGAEKRRMIERVWMNW